MNTEAKRTEKAPVERPRTETAVHVSQTEKDRKGPGELSPERGPDRHGHDSFF